MALQERHQQEGDGGEIGSGFSTRITSSFSWLTSGAAKGFGGAAVVLVCVLAVCQGGFYAGATCTAGLVASAAYVGWVVYRRIGLRRTRAAEGRGGGEPLRASAATVLLLAIACLQLASAIVHGASATMLLEASTWFAVAGASFWCAFRSADEKRRCLGAFGVTGAAIAAVGVVLYCGAVPVKGAVSAGRLMFPFQYANASGVFFGVAAVTCVGRLPRAWKILAVVPVAALVLTQSVGAIAVSAVALAIVAIRELRQTRLPKIYGAAFAAIVVLALVGATALAQGRIAEASQTFVERVIQMLDASALLVGNLAFGIGPDQWQLACPLVQTAQYRAAVVHCSYLQMALDAGVLAALLLVAFLVRGIARCVRAGDITGALCSGAIAVHALVDFDFQFSALMLLAVLCMADSSGETGAKAEEAFAKGARKKDASGQAASHNGQSGRKLPAQASGAKAVLPCGSVRAGWASRALTGFVLAACLVASSVGMWLSALEADLADAYVQADGGRAAELISTHAALRADGVLAAYATGALFASGDYQGVIEVADWQAADNVAESALMYRIYSLRALGQADDARALLADTLHVRPYDVELYKILREYVVQAVGDDNALAESFNAEAVRANELSQEGHAAWLSNQEPIEQA